MKIENTSGKNIVITNGDFEGSAMTIKSRRGIAMATKFLSDRLYTNKPAAVIREALCNALDEHKKYAVTRPVEINIKDNVFTCRDFAKGLSKEDTQNVFGMFFESTKSDTNDFIGGFGIGAKSPFAYTNSWYVTSYFEGVKYEFICIKEQNAEDGLDETKMYSIGESPTTESGIEVKVPLVQGDINTFRYEFAEIAKYLDTPVLFNGTLTEVTEHKDLVIGCTSLGHQYKHTASTMMQIKFETNRYGGIEQTYTNFTIDIIVGVVHYTINSTMLMGQALFADFKSDVLFRFFVYSRNFYLGNGAVTVSPNRENIELDRRTIVNLHDILFTAYSKWVEELTDLGTNHKNTDDLVKFYNQHGKYLFDKFVKPVSVRFISRKYAVKTERHANLFLQESKEIDLFSQIATGRYFTYAYTLVLVENISDIPDRIRRDLASVMWNDKGYDTVRFLTTEEYESIRNCPYLSQVFAQDAKTFNEYLESTKDKVSSESYDVVSPRRKGLVTFLRESLNNNNYFVEDKETYENLSTLYPNTSYIDNSTLLDSHRRFLKNFSKQDVIMVKRAPKDVHLCTFEDFAERLEYNKTSYTVALIAEKWSDKATVGDIFVIANQFYDDFKNVFPEGDNTDLRLHERYTIGTEFGVIFRPILEKKFPNMEKEVDKLLTFIDKFSTKNDISEAIEIIRFEQERKNAAHHTDFSTYNKIMAFDIIFKSNPDILKNLIEKVTI